jgi:hypothetical protein
MPQSVAIPVRRPTSIGLCCLPDFTDLLEREGASRSGAAVTRSSETALPFRARSTGTLPPLANVTFRSVSRPNRSMLSTSRSARSSRRVIDTFSNVRSNCRSASPRTRKGWATRVALTPSKRSRLAGWPVCHTPRSMS